MANLANVAAAIAGVSQWQVGFYLVDPAQDNGAWSFQGPVACTRLFRGKGVCAGLRREPPWWSPTCMLPNHAACSSSRKARSFFPWWIQLGVQAVLDIDSAEEDDFTNEEVATLERLTQRLSARSEDMVSRPIGCTWMVVAALFWAVPKWVRHQGQIDKTPPALVFANHYGRGAGRTGTWSWNLTSTSRCET